jgi:hypothetical protein
MDVETTVAMTETGVGDSEPALGVALEVICAEVVVAASLNTIVVGPGRAWRAGSRPSGRNDA